MSHPPLEPPVTGGFDADWLQQREPFDLAARDAALATAFAAALPRRAEHPVRLVDLAAGTGANLRALAPLIGGDQDWLLVDHDPQLLAAQRAHITAWASEHGWRTETEGSALLVHASPARWRIQRLDLDLAQSLHRLDLPRFDGIVTTAFLDLVSAGWLDALSQQIAQARRPLLATLTVDAQRHWQPPHPDDAPLLAVFAQHQGGDKGFGPALGPSAVAHLAERLCAAGLTVQQAPSPWRIGAGHTAMLEHMVAETAQVAREAGPEHARLATRWQALRHCQIRQNALQLTIGHVDLLALPIKT